MDDGEDLEDLWLFEYNCYLCFFGFIHVEFKLLKIWYYLYIILKIIYKKLFIEYI